MGKSQGCFCQCAEDSVVYIYRLNFEPIKSTYSYMYMQVYEYEKYKKQMVVTENWYIKENCPKTNDGYHTKAYS